MFIKALLTSFFGSKARRNQSLAIVCATLITGALLTGVASAQSMMPTPPVNPTVITNIGSAVAREMTAGINEVISSTTRSALHANDDAADADDDAVHAGAVADAKGAANVCAGMAVSEDGECAAK